MDKRYWLEKWKYMRCCMVSEGYCLTPVGHIRCYEYPGCLYDYDRMFIAEQECKKHGIT